MYNVVLFKDPTVLDEVPQVKDIRTPIVLDGLRCRVTDPSLGQCNRLPVVEYCSHSDDAGAFCVRTRGKRINQLKLIMHCIFMYII